MWNWQQTCWEKNNLNCIALLYKAWKKKPLVTQGLVNLKNCSTKAQLDSAYLASVEYFGIIYDDSINKH